MRASDRVVPDSGYSWFYHVRAGQNFTCMSPSEVPNANGLPLSMGATLLDGVHTGILQLPPDSDTSTSIRERLRSAELI